MGPDDIHPKLLKSLAENHDFVKSLTLLYNKCIEECKIPTIWKTANVVALHKKGSKKEALNYRPVSLTCILCKVYEQFLRRHILMLVEDKICNNQHGFVERRSCLSNLLETVDTIIDMLGEGSRDRPGSRQNPGPGQNRPICRDPGPGQNREIYRDPDRDSRI